MSRPVRSVHERFWEKVEKTDTCWLWRNPPNQRGYGQFWFEGKVIEAHLLCYRLMVGHILSGFELDHLCRVPLCVRPAHLQPVPHLLNVQRGESGAWQRAKTQCPQGHQYTVDNIYWTRGGRTRTCRTCQLERKRNRNVV